MERSFRHGKIKASTGEKAGRLLPVLAVLFFIHCNQGLSPEAAGPTLTGISGTIFYRNWPPADSLFDLRLVIFRQYPPEDILSAIVNGEAIAYPPITENEGLPTNVNQTQFRVELPPGRYEYIAVAWRYGPNVLSDWKAAGQYDVDDTPEPTPVELREGELLSDIDIDVDFANPPPSPF